MELIDRTPMQYRRRGARDLGIDLAVTNQERERLRLWTIAPYDMSDEDMRAQRRAKERNRKRRRRQSLPRSAYIADSVSRQRPWLAMGISRRTWYRRRGGTSLSRTNTSKGWDIPVPPSKPFVSKMAVRWGECVKSEREDIVRESPKSTDWSSVTDDELSGTYLCHHR
jgi:hypothetical protein